MFPEILSSERKVKALRMSTNHYSIITWIIIIWPQVLVNSCQVYPSEYAYQNKSVAGTERSNTNCSMYPSDLKPGVHTQHYIHCNGSELRLTDSDFEREQYSAADHYVWAPGKSSQLLFIFPTSVNLTNITLHYYRDSVGGLPRLRFLGVPDDFNIWDAPTIQHRYIEVNEVPPGEGSMLSVSVSANFNVARVLMYKDSSIFWFSLREVEFFTSCGTTTTTTTTTTTGVTSTTALTAANETSTTALPDPSNPPKESTSISATSATEYSTTAQLVDLDTPQQSADNNRLPPLVAAITTVIVLLIAALILVVILLLWLSKRIHKPKMKSKSSKENNTLYSILDRERKQQIQPQSLSAPTELYDQIQLSPSTGQQEPISKKDSQNINIKSLSSPDYHNPHVNEELLETEKTTSVYLTHAAMDKKRQTKQQSTSKNNTYHEIPKGFSTADHEESDAAEKPIDQLSQRQENIEEMYAVVYKKPKKHEEQEEVLPPVPSHTIESLYAAVQKPK